ncbi:MAG: hypothetical protein E7H54_05935 [Clostridium perfringens]|nr:hypothetical protein [Clostridium perfringens]
MSCRHCELNINFDTEQVNRVCTVTGESVGINCHCENFSEKRINCSSALIDNNSEIKMSELL